MKKKLSKIGNIIFYIIMAFLLITGIQAKKNNEIPSFFGYSFMHVISPSMEDYIMTNDVAIGHKVAPNDEIIIGNVYIYEAESGLKIIHRIIDQNDDGTYVFKGDNNPVADYAPVNRDQIEFMYLFKIPKLGHIVLLFKNPYFYAVVIACILAFELIEYMKKKKNNEQANKN